MSRTGPENQTVSPITRRAFARWPVSLDGRVESEEFRFNCRILDLSVGGAKIAIPYPMPKGVRITLNTLTYGQFEAEVVWANQNRAGLHFTSSTEEVAETLHALAVYGGNLEQQSDAMALSRKSVEKTRNDNATFEPQPSEDIHTLQTENRDLRNTVTALREELEQLNFSISQQVQSALAQSEAESAQLHEMITSLRNALEEERYDHQVQRERLVAEQHDEQEQLRETVEALRQNMEQVEADARQKEETLVRLQQEEQEQLMDTIDALREKLEAIAGTGDEAVENSHEP